ncbi:hypothetical protein CANCADRAFT_18363, partial [Tortispora caseinolytica NRRL Y-17796]
SGIHGKYAVSSRPSFTAGPWTVYDAKSKAKHDPPAVSVFVFEKKKLNLKSSREKRMLEPAIARLKDEVSLMTKLRHPSLLEIIEPLEVSRSGTLTFVAERVTSSLVAFTDSKRMGRAKRSNADVDEIEIQKGLFMVAKGLEFLHQTANRVHLNIRPQSVLVNAKDDWKLAGLAFSISADNFATGYQIDPYDFSLPHSLQIDLNYCAPELVLKQQVDSANDIFSFGCLIASLYIGVSPIDSRQDFNEYGNIIRKNPSSLHVPSLSSFPSYLASILPQLLATKPTERITATEFINSKYFDNIVISTIRFLDSLPARTVAEKNAFFSGFANVANQFPKPVLQRKVLPAFVQEYGKEDSLDEVVFNSIILISSDMSQLSFSEQVLPTIKSLKDNPGSHKAFLTNMDVLLKQLSKKDFKETVLPLLVRSMDSTDFQVLEKAMLTVSPILPSLDFLVIKNTLFPKVSDVFTKTSSLAVKIASLNALESLLAGGLDKPTVLQSLIPLIQNLKSRDPDLITATLGLFTGMKSVLDYSALATDVIPIMYNFLVTSSLNQQQFTLFASGIRDMTETILTEKSNTLS